MLGRLFGRKGGRGGDADAEAAADEAFAEAKQAALERALGPMDEMVLHSLVPFFMGGDLDLYMFSRCMPGTVVATQELIGRGKKERPRAGRIGAYELVACMKPGVVLETEASEDGGAGDGVGFVTGGERDGIGLVRRMLNPLAQYAFMARLNPGETAEIPMGEGEPNLPVLFDEFRPEDRGLAPFEVGGERFGLLLCVPLHGSELAFARQEGTGKLKERLEAAGVWPYADLSRAAVV